MKYVMVHWDPANIADSVFIPTSYCTMDSADSIYDAGQIIDKALNDATLNRIVIVIDKNKE